jgi:CSLREA domain-containing protein
MAKRTLPKPFVAPGASPLSLWMPTRRLIGSGVWRRLRHWLVLALVAALLAALIPLAAPVPAVQAATFTVTTSADGTDASPGDGVCETAPGNGVCTLRAAIEEANANVFASHDTIYLPAGTYTLSVGSHIPPDGTTDLDIRESLTLIGDGAIQTTIDGGGHDRVFEIAPFGGHVPQVTISGVTIRNGATGQGGGGIYNQGATLSLSGCYILNNSAADGGGLYNQGGSVTLTGSSIVGGNTADFQGGGIYNQDGTLTFEDGLLGCLDNTATFGGGLFNDGGVVELTRITQCNGRAEPAAGSGYGGAIYNMGGGTVTITRSRLQNNVAAGGIGYGGGIFNTSTASRVNLIDSSISASRAVSSIGSGYGGGILNTSGAAMHIEGSLISFNWVEKAGGLALAGGIYNLGSSSLMTITNSTISGNQAPDSGGGVYNSAATLSMQYVTLSHNTADSDADGVGEGGGIYNTGGGTVNLQNTIIAANSDASPGTQYADCAGVLNSGDYNLIQDTTGCTLIGPASHTITGQPANLDSLKSNGGPTASRALLAGSPAINAGLCVAGIGVDQRGLLRPGLGDPRCDIGAYEAKAGIPTYLPLIVKNGG